MRRVYPLPADDPVYWPQGEEISGIQGHHLGTGCWVGCDVMAIARAHDQHGMGVDCCTVQAAPF